MARLGAQLAALLLLLLALAAPSRGTKLQVWGCLKPRRVIVVRNPPHLQPPLAPPRHPSCNRRRPFPPAAACCRSGT